MQQIRPLHSALSPNSIQVAFVQLPAFHASYVLLQSLHASLHFNLGNFCYGNVLKRYGISALLIMLNSVCPYLVGYY